MNKSKFLTSCIITASLLGLCKVASTSSINQVITNSPKLENRLHSKNKSNNIEPPTQIGYGYDSRTSLPRIRNCFLNYKDPNNVKYRNLVGSVHFDRSMSSSQLSSLTNVNISGSGGFGWFSASVAANYVKDTFNSRYSENFNYGQTFAADAIYDLPEGFGAKILNQSAREALEAGPERFGTFCGDSYITNGKAGAVLLVSVGIDFATAADKERFNASFSGGISGIATVASAFERAVASRQVNGMLRLRALQLGGEPQKLAHIFGLQNFDTQYAIISCTPENTQHCKGIISNVIKYAQEHFGPGVNLNDPKTLYNFGVSREPYANLGISGKLPDLTPEAKVAQDFVVKQIQEDKLAADFLAKYIVSPIWGLVEDRSKGIIVSTEKQYKNLIQHYNYYGILSMCYGVDVNNTCPKAASYIKEEHTKVNSHIVNALKKVWIGSTGINMVRLISINPYNVHHATDPLSVYGGFAIYDPNAKLFDTSGACVADFYKTPHWAAVPGDHNIVCWNGGIVHTAIPPRLYIKRFPGEPVQDYGRAGRVGYYINGAPYDVPTNRFGYSTVFTPFNNWDYNPI